MKKLVKICAITGLVLLVLGIGITTVSSAMGGRYRSSFPARLWSRIWHNHSSWLDNRGYDWDNDWYDDWDDDWDDYDDRYDDPRWQHWSENELYGSSQDSPANSHAVPETVPGTVTPSGQPDTPGPGAADPSAQPDTPAPGSADPSAQPATPAPGSANSSAQSDTPVPGSGNSSAQSGTPVPGSANSQSNPAFSRARKLDIDVDKGVINISEKDGISQIEINVQDNYNRTECYMDKETLKIKRESVRRSNDAPYIQVLVPAGYELEKLSIDMGAAECNVLGITTGKLDIDTGVGAVTFTGTVNGNVEIETGVGDVTLNMTGPQNGYNYKVECGVGSINVGSEHYTMLSHETHINNNAPYNMELECGVGNITVNFDTSL